MRHAQRSTRTSSAPLVSTAGALVALVAVAAMMTSSAVAAPSASVGESRQTMTEGAKVRAAVAAVAAAARKLVEGHRLVHALSANWPSIASASSVASTPIESPLAIDPPLAALPERLLDLPPPTR